MSDRIAVMADGRLQQVGAPAVLYERPANLFVARFLGESNVLPWRSPSGASDRQPEWHPAARGR